MLKRNHFISLLLKLYEECFEYISLCRKYILFIFSIFLISSFLGFFISPPEEALNFLLEYISQILEKTRELGLFGLIFFIFQNNFQASLLGLTFGIFLGIFPIFLSLFNGYVLGIVASISVAQQGVWSLLTLLPHGIFELPAVFITFGMGLKMGEFFFQKEKIPFLRKNSLKALKVLFLIIVPLLILAAIIEGTAIFLMR